MKTGWAAWFGLILGIAVMTAILTKIHQDNPDGTLSQHHESKGHCTVCRCCDDHCMKMDADER